MKTTLNFDDRLLRAAKMRAAQDGDTLTRLIERALRDYLRPARERPTGFRAELLTKRGGAGRRRRPRRPQRALRENGRPRLIAVDCSRIEQPVKTVNADERIPPTFGARGLHG